MNQHTPTPGIFEVQRSFLHSQFPRCHKLSKHPSTHHSAGVRTRIDYKILSEWPTMRQRRSPPLPSGIRLETPLRFLNKFAIAIRTRIWISKKEATFPTVWWKMMEVCCSILFDFTVDLCLDHEHCPFFLMSCFQTLQAEVLLFLLLEVTVHPKCLRAANSWIANCVLGILPIHFSIVAENHIK